MKKQKPTWKDIKAILSKKTESEILKLVGDLYSLSEENKTFIHSRYAIGVNPLEPYKNIISEALYPDVMYNEPIQLSVGRKAISDYFKATQDKMGQIELMFHYLETGNQFTLDLGDIDESFYSSLESTFDRILSSLEKQHKTTLMDYLPRLESIVESVCGMGWGYYDYLHETLNEYKIKHLSSINE